jgi:sugar phosphate isomerase/epimerase
MGKIFLGGGLFEAIEVTHYEHMADFNTAPYNDAILEIIDLYHPQVLTHAPGFNLSEESLPLRAAVLEEIEHCVIYTRALGGREVVIHSGAINQGKHLPNWINGKAGSREDFVKRSWDLSVRMMREICGIAEKYRMIIYTENLGKDDLTLSGESLVRYLRDVGCKNLKVVFDVGHCHCNNGERAIPDEIRVLKGELKHLHIHDNPGNSRDAHLQLGEGSIDFQAFASALSEIGYSGLYMFELMPCSADQLSRSYEILKDCILKASG